MAEYILRSRAAGLGLGESVLVDSAATSAEETGNPVHPRTAAILDTLGIDCSAKRARQMQRSDYETYDYLIGMDRMNVADMRRIAGGDPDGKICRLLDFAANRAILRIHGIRAILTQPVRTFAQGATRCSNA